MRKSALFLLLLSSVLFLVPQTVFANYSGGSGTAAAPYLISSVGDYNQLVYNSHHWDKHFKLTATLDFGNATINPIKHEYGEIFFTGIFDGNDFSFRRFKITDYNAALFNAVGDGAVIRNLTLSDATITATGGLSGVLACWLEGGAIINCTVSGEVKGGSRSGGLVAQASNSLISDCHSAATVTGGSSSMSGGLAGLCFDSIITRSQATGAINSTGSESGRAAGGLAGGCYNSIVTDCCARGAVRGQTAGGLIGETEYGGKASEISQCYATGQVTGQGDPSWVTLGGLLASGNVATVTASYWNLDSSQVTESAGGEGRSTVEMTHPHAANCYVGWDFDTVWKSDTTNTNNGYPSLQAVESADLAQLFCTKIAPVSTFQSPGTSIPYTIAIRNVGTLALTDITVEDTLCDFSQSLDVLHPGGEIEYQPTYTVTQEDFDEGGVLNRAEVTGTDPNGKSVSAYATAYVEAEYIEELEVTITSDSLTIQEKGETISFTITVENTGNMPLSEITISNPLTNLNEVISELAPGASASFETAHVVTDWNMRTGFIKNTATASFEDRQGGTLSFPGELVLNITYLEGAYSGGDGSSANPFLISSLEDLDHFSSSPEDWHKHFKLIADLDFTDEEFYPLDTYELLPFSGTFDGNGHYLRNIDMIYTQDSALFDVVDGALIRNLHLEAITVEGWTVSATLASFAENSTFINCSAQGSFDPGHMAGGLVAYADNCQFIGCSSISQIDNSWNWCMLAGGLVGHAQDSHFLNCYARGNLEALNNEGGLVGQLISKQITSTITNCYAAVEIEPWSDRPIGLVGEITGGATISASYWDKELSSEYSGGGEGRTTSEMTHPHGSNCYVGWDFNKIWLKDTAGLNAGYPRLRPAQDNDQGQLLVTIEADSQNFYTAGHRIQYLVTVANVGTLSMHYLSVVDSVTALYAFIDALQPGERTHFEISYTATQDDVDNGIIENLITVSGYTANWDYLSREGHYKLEFLEPIYDLQIMASPSTADFVQVGAKISYDVWIDNAGNAPLRDIVILNEKEGYAETFPFLDAEDYTYVAMEYTVTQEDWDAGEVVQTFLVTARDVLGNEITSSNTVTTPKAFTSDYTAGSGTESDPYIITTVEDWLDLTQIWRDWNQHFIIAADLDFEGVPVQPIGDPAQNRRFGGSIDGAGHTLKNITLIGGNVALFHEIYRGSIRDLHLDNITVNASTHGAALAVTVNSNSTITGCSSSGVIEAAGRAGGLVARSSYSTYTECWSTASVTGKWAGGLVDTFYSDEFTDCYALGTVTGTERAGGLLGQDEAYFTVSTISRCYAAAEVTLIDSSGKAGGLVADGDNTVLETIASYWDTQASEQTDSVVGTGCTTTQMTYPYTGTCYEGWDFDEIWADDTEGGNSGYPFLLRDPRNEKNSLHLSKTTSHTTFSHSGEEISYTLLVFNTGTTVLTDLEVQDPLTGFSATFQELLPGSGEHFETSYTISQMDMDAHYLINTATATGTGSHGEEVTVSDSVLLRKEITAGYSGGSGTKTDPYRIAKSGDWLDLTETMDDWDKYFRLTADLDFLNVPISPIEDPAGWKKFEGSLDGAGYSMKNIVMSGTNLYLFRSLKNATVKNLHLENITLQTAWNAAGLALYADDCTISDCSFSGTITADGYAAGLVDDATRTNFTNCLVSAAITGGARTAGMVNTADDCTFTACTTSGTLFSDGNYWTGGLVAEMESSSVLSECRSTVDLHVAWAGGLVGMSTNSTIENCYARGKVIGVHGAGGLVGDSRSSSIENSYATGEVYASSETGDAGGLIGKTNTSATVEKSYWDRQSAGITTSAGGEGRSTQDMTYPYATDCYVGWDFETLWAADDTGINNGYPRLRNDAEDEHRALNIIITAPSDPFSEPGVEIPFTMTVQNISSQPISEITVQNPMLNFLEIIAALDPGDAVTFTPRYTVIQADLDKGYVESIATASALLPGGRSTSVEAVAKVMANVENRIQVTKFATSSSFLAVNDEISYLIQVKNTGKQTLHDILLLDPLTGLEENIAVLAPGQSVQRNTTYTVTQDDLNVGTISNTATAAGIDPAGNMVTDSDTAFLMADNAAYSVQAASTADITSFTGTGDSIEYTFTVVNTGSATLTNIAVQNTLTGLSETIGTLGPGGKRIFPESYTVTQADVDAGKVEVSFTAQCTAPNGTLTEDSSTLVLWLRAFPVDMCLDLTTLSRDLQAARDENVQIHSALFNTAEFYGLPQESIIDGQLTMEAVKELYYMRLNRLTLGYDFKDDKEEPLGISIYYRECTGPVNLMINGERQIVEDFSELFGMTIGGVTVRDFPRSHDLNILQLQGTVSSFSIGAESILLETICSYYDETEVASHPADTDNSGIINETEATEIIEDWQEGTMPMPLAIRAQYIKAQGGGYTFDPTQAPPLCWSPE